MREVMVLMSSLSAIDSVKQPSKFSLIRSALLLFGTTHIPSPVIQARTTCAVVLRWMSAMYLICGYQPFFSTWLIRDLFDSQADLGGVQSLFDPGPQVQVHPLVDNER